MALKKSIADPTGVSPISEAYIRIVETNFNFADNIGRVTLNVYRDRESRDANKPPVTNINFYFGSSRVAELDQEGNTIRPAFPSFATLIEANQEQYDAIKAALYNLLKLQPELSGSEDV